MINRVFLDEDRTIDASMSSDASFLSPTLSKSHKVNPREIGHYFSLYIQQIKKDFNKSISSIVNDFYSHYELFLEDKILIQDHRKQQKRLYLIINQLKPEIQIFQEKYTQMKAALPLVSKKRKSHIMDHRKVKLIEIMQRALLNEKQNVVSRVKSPTKSSMQTSTSSRLYYDQNLQKAQIFYDRQRYQDSILILKSLIKKYQNQPEIHFILGNCYKSTQSPSQAIKQYTKAINLVERGSYYNNRGNSYLSIGDNGKALQDYRRAIQIQPENDVYFANYGNACINLKMYKEAISSYNKAISLEPSKDSFFNNRAFANIRLARFDEALDDYAQAIEINPLGHVYLKNRANIYIDKKNFDKAEKDLKQALEIQPNRAEYHFMLGKCLYLSGKMRSAQNCIKNAVELYPQKQSYRLFYEALQNQARML